MTHPPTTRIFAIRHGETAWNVDTRIQGQIDIPLNDTGHWQARRLGQALEAEGIVALYASDLARAQQTAQALGQALSLPVHLDAGLRERAFGCFEGCTHSEIETRWPLDARRWRQREPDFGPDGGETLTDFYRRCVGAAEQLAHRHAGQSIALVAHGGVLDCLYRAATRQALHAPRTWSISNASINRLLHTPDGFTLVGWADVQHLEAGALDESNDGDTAWPAAALRDSRS